jgi:hypothetical protein
MIVGLVIVGLFNVGLVIVGLFNVGLVIVGLFNVGLVIVGLFIVGLINVTQIFLTFSFSYLITKLMTGLADISSGFLKLFIT